MGELLALATALLFGTAANLMPRAAQHLDQNLGLLISILVNFAANIGTVTVRAALGPPFQFSWRGLAFFMLAGSFTTLLGRWFWFRAIMTVGPSRATTWKTSQIILILTGGYLLLQEPVSGLSLTGVVLVVAGVYTLNAGREGPQPQSAATPGPDPRLRRQGLLFGAGTGLSFAVGNLLRKAGILAWPEPLVAALVGAGVAAVGFVAMPGARRVWRDLLRTPPGRGHLWWGLVGLATTGAQLSLFTALLHAPVYVVQAIAGAEPLLTPLLGLAMLRDGERRDTRLWLSAALVTFGVVAVALR